ncbi:hypothetical protein M728_001868 [Ensifer sp. WSM1721]
MRRYAVLNVVRVLLCVAVTAVACRFLYHRLFRYKMAVYIVGLYAFSFVPRPNVSISKRLASITLTALAFGVAYMACGVLYHYLTLGIVPSELTEGDVTTLRYPLAALLYLVLGPHYFVFILSYITSELLVMKRIAPGPGPTIAQGGN